MALSQKPCIFLSSTGRTGTRFFGETLSKMIDDSVSVHEPDTTRVSEPRAWIEKMAKFGVGKMLWGQYRECYSLGKLSTTRHRGLTNDGKARRYVTDNRFEYIEHFRKNIYIESNHLLYGVIDLVTELFPNSKVIWIIRDPRSWVRSALSAGAYHLYGIWDWDSINLSIRAYNFPDDPDRNRWKKMSKFEKYCWYYARVNYRAFELMKKVPDFKIFRFEDLFNRKTRDRYFSEMLDYATDFNSGYQPSYTYKPELLDKKIHAAASKRQLPKWQNWGKAYVQALNYHCGGIMKQFDYGTEPEWQQKLADSDRLRYRA